MQEQGGGDRKVVGQRLSGHAPQSEARQAALDQPGVEPAGEHVGVLKQQSQELDVGVHAEYHGLGERPVEAGQSLGAVSTPGDHLREHRVVDPRDQQARPQRTVHPDALSNRFRQAQHAALSRQKPAGRVLGVDARLDRVPGEHHLGLGERQRLPRGDPKLPLDQVEAGDQLGDRVLDLQPGVHLHEEELVRGGVGDQELDRAGAGVADAPGCLAGCLADAGAGRRVEQRRGSLLDHLLVAALQGAFAFAEVDDGARAVGEHLHLDVTGGVDEALEQQCVVAERALSHAPGRDQRGGQLAGGVNPQHPLAAAARGRFDQQRVAHCGRGGDELLVAPARLGEPGDDADAALGDVVLAADLVPHHGEGVQAGADEGEAGGGAGAGEGLVLAQEPVAGVHRVGAGGRRGGEDRVDVQVAGLRRGRAEAHRDIREAHVQCSSVGIAVDGHGTDAHGAQGADDAAGDLAAVGNQNGLEGFHGGPHIRKRPKAVSGRGDRATTSRARPSTVRVSAGSITPSSQSLAVE